MALLRKSIIVGWGASLGILGSLGAPRVALAQDEPAPAEPPADPEPAPSVTPESAQPAEPTPPVTAEGAQPAESAPNGASPGVVPEEAPEQNLGAVVVTGVRGTQPRTVADSPSPIDVIDVREVTATGRSGLKEILGAIVPAMTMPAQGGGGTSASVRPYAYRGLSGDYLLVLVNGKRRHTTALINNLSRISGGSTPVDLDLIPAPAVKRIEILRDGAAAQYGSDAISGVLNIILDDRPEGIGFTQTAGKTYSKGAELFQQTLSLGTPLGKKGGFFRFFAEGKFRNASKSAGDPAPELRANGQPNYYYPPIAVDQPDPREAKAEGRVTAGGYGRSNRDLMLVLGYNAELPLSEHFKLYSFSTLSYRNIKDARGSFNANDINSLPEIYPDGFQAYRRIWEWDGQATIGLQGDIRSWDFDLSSSYGRDSVKLGAENVLNPSLGPTSKTSFYMGRQFQDLWVTNLDVSHEFDVGFATPLQLAFGFEHRWERFENREGEPDSYRDGGYQIPIGDDPFHQPPLPGGVGGFGGLYPNPGLASFTGTSPEDARVLSRNNIAAYAELSSNIVKPWFVGIAGRAEHYDDSAGNVVSGKIATRYDFIEGLGVRAGANTGFRAPSLAQTGFSTTQNTASIVGGERVTNHSKFLAVDSEAAKALGARPLTPEKSLSVSAGAAFEYENAFRVTVDGYLTKIKDRIVKTDFIGTSVNGGAAIQQLFLDRGVVGVNAAQFFLNAIDTTTRGLDLVAEYTLRHPSVGSLRPSVALSYARTEIDHVRENPPELASLNVVLFGRQGQRDLTFAVPKAKLILGLNWAFNRVKADVHVTRWGKYEEASTTPGNDLKFGEKWITDAEVGYDISDYTSLAVGATNLFDVYPDKNGLVSLQGYGGYGAFAPFGLTGGFYYARFSLDI